MELVVESITGRRRTFNNVSPQETVRGLKTRLWKLDGVPIAQQSFVYRNEALDDDKTLQHYKVIDGAVVKLVLITRAGPINKTVEPAPKKVEISLATSMGARGDAAEGGDIANSSTASAVRRYTRQQMRQVQLACVSGKSAVSKGCPDGVQASSSVVDSSVAAERQTAAANRAEENWRTMQRMRELRRSIERLNLEKSQINGQRQRNAAGGLSACAAGESGPARTRRPTGGSGSTVSQANGSNASSTGGARTRTSTQIVVTCSDRYSAAAAAAAARAAYAADDTSAKESSAGETEIEDATYCRQLTANSSTSAAKPSIPNTSVARTRGQWSSQQLMPPPGFKSKHQLFRNIRCSSCSDVDVESSAVWSSDPEADGVFHNDRSNEELFTAEDWSLDDDVWVGERGDDAQKTAPVVDSSDYEDATACSGRRENEVAPFPQSSDRHSSSADDDKASAATAQAADGLLYKKDVGQDISSDPSELSSGVVICELAMAMNNRRLKVKRKSYHTPRHGYKRPQPPATSAQAAARGAAVDETDDQSPLDSPVKCVGLSEGVKSLPPRFVHQNAPYRDQHLHAGYVPVYVVGGATRNWHRGRPRSKQRLQITAPSASLEQQTTGAGFGIQTGQQCAANSTTTGDSSSDEREDTGRRESQAAASMQMASAAASNSGRPCGHGHKPPQSSQSQQRCNACACRLSVASTFHCRCGKTVCLRHRHADLHACSLLAAAAVVEKK